MGNKKQVQLDNYLIEMMNKVDMMTPEERVQFEKKLNIRRKLVDAELSRVGSCLNKTENIIENRCEGGDRDKAIYNWSITLSALAAGAGTLALAKDCYDPDIVKLAYVSLGAATGGVIGLTVYGMLSTLDDACQNLKKHCLSRRQAQLEDKKMNNDRIAAYLTSKEEMGE